MEAAPTEILEVGGLSIRPRESTALAEGRTLPLTAHEVRLLAALARRAERIVSREELYALAWGGTLRAGDRSVDVYVHRLRAKLERALPQWRFIHTHVGLGYRFGAERSHAFHIATTAR